MEAVGLGGLFLSSFISATLFPGGSEVVLAMLAAGQQHNPWLLLGIASIGNTLGAISTWGLGYFLAPHFSAPDRWSARQRRAVLQLRHWGSPALLLSWVPFLGDPLCFAAGFLRLPFFLSLLFIAVGKTARYALVLIAFV